MSKGLCEILRLKRLLIKIDLAPNTKMNMYYNNKVAIQISHNSVQCDHTKHVKADRHFIKQNFEEKIIQIFFCQDTSL